MLSNKKAVNAVGYFIVIIGFIVGFYMAGKMEAGIFLRMISAIATGAVAYVIVAANSSE